MQFPDQNVIHRLDITVRVFEQHLYKNHKLISLIFDKIRSKYGIVFDIASSGISVTLLDGGRTTIHS